jgi:hypothetical protein
MLSMSIPSNRKMEISGYFVPFLMSETINSFELMLTQKVKYNNLLESISEKFNDISFATTKMFYMVNSKIIGKHFNLII